MIRGVRWRRSRGSQALRSRCCAWARGLAAGDLDNDGRTDVVVVSQNEPVAFLHNQTDGGHSLTLRLEGTTSNRDAVGAIVSVHCEGRVRIAPRLGGGSFQSAGDPRLHFGLGAARQADRVERALAVRTHRSIQEPCGRRRLSPPRG